ncbi:MAG: hypothetical protein AB7H70_16415 [Rhodospirillaceae bacterium]
MMDSPIAKCLRKCVLASGLSVFAPIIASVTHARAETAVDQGVEDYVREELPPGINVSVNELEGPVFIDSAGKTLYFWPIRSLRNGDTGDRKNSPSNCTGEVMKESSGLMSPYPAGLILPDLSQRKSCQEVWPPALASEDATTVGKWSVIPRQDGRKQWAYDGYPLYTSVLDKSPGDVLGGTRRRIGSGDEPAVRMPAGPRPNVPPAFSVRQVGTGRMIVNQTGFSVYSSDKDGPNKSNCAGPCLSKWTPVLAGRAAQPQGEWSVFERSQGVRQWAFRGKPLYTFNDDPKGRSLIGSDEPGWHNVYTQRAPAAPREFTQQDTHAGIVLADGAGKTIYIYSCGDDALDQLACDHPGSPQEYRLAVCGGGDAARCAKTWPLVLARKDAESPSRVWTIINIDPLSGRLTSPDAPQSVRAWAYRGRPVYTYAGDQPGDVNGDSLGEFYGSRNGFKAFWLRDDFLNNAG